MLRDISAQSLTDQRHDLAHSRAVAFTTMTAAQTDLLNRPESCNVALVVPWYGGSHKSWADAVVRHSLHNVRLVTHAPRYWRWRFSAGPVTLAALLEEAYVDGRDPMSWLCRR